MGPKQVFFQSKNSLEISYEKCGIFNNKTKSWQHCKVVFVRVKAAFWRSPLLCQQQYQHNSISSDAWLRAVMERNQATKPTILFFWFSPPSLPFSTTFYFCQIFQLCIQRWPVAQKTIDRCHQIKKEKKNWNDFVDDEAASLHYFTIY